jgi:ABC-type molybdate transport system substrate-binding protein
LADAQRIGRVWQRQIHDDSSIGQGDDFRVCKYGNRKRGIIRLQVSSMFGEKTMKMRLFLCVAVLAVLFTVSSVFAADTVCTTPATTPTTTIAVASNFFGPAQTMATNFQNANPGQVVKVCHNATSDLETEILNNPGRYGMFFSADEIDSAFLEELDDSDYEPFLYAHGIPVYFGYVSSPPSTSKTKLITNVGSLITGLGSGNYYEVSETEGALADLEYTVASPGAVAVANSTTAPYGTMANAIFSEFETYPSTTPQFDNISLTFNAVGNTQSLGTPPVSYDVYSGVVSRAQICNIKPYIAYVEFTGYALDQRAIQLTDTADSLYTYIQGQMSGASSPWNTFLTQNCYGALP